MSEEDYEEKEIGLVGGVVTIFVVFLLIGTVLFFGVKLLERLNGDISLAKSEVCEGYESTYVTNREGDYCVKNGEAIPFVMDCKGTTSRTLEGQYTCVGFPLNLKQPKEAMP